MPRVTTAQYAWCDDTPNGICDRLASRSRVVTHIGPQTNGTASSGSINQHRRSSTRYHRGAEPARLRLTCAHPNLLLETTNCTMDAGTALRRSWLCSQNLCHHGARCPTPTKHRAGVARLTISRRDGWRCSSCFGCCHSRVTSRAAPLMR